MNRKRWLHTGAPFWRKGHDQPYEGLVIGVRKRNLETHEGYLEWLAVTADAIKVFSNSEEAKKWLDDK